MKREDILVYLTVDKIYLYLLNSKKEYVESLDTSPFFKFGEISNVEYLTAVMTKIVSKMNFGLYYLKPNLHVLYNDVCSCDIKFLYRSAFAPLGYNKINFVRLTKLARSIKDHDNLVIGEGNYYTLVKRGEKVSSIKDIDFEPIILGASDKKHIHYSDEDIIWKSFKSCFTNKSSYDIIDIGDDVC